MASGRPSVSKSVLGSAIGCVLLLTACGSGGGGEPTWATVTTTGATYRLAYQLDPERRIKSYEMRNDATDALAHWCSGDLHASWECFDEAHDPHSSASATVDEQGRPRTYARPWDGLFGETIEYSYNAKGRLVQVGRSQSNCCGDTISRTSTFEYDAVDNLSAIRLRVFSAKNSTARSDSTYTVLSPSAIPTYLRLVKTGAGGGEFTIQLSHDRASRYTQRVVNEVTADGERIASNRSYVIDSHGYVTSLVSEQYQYEAGLTPVLRTEDTRCLEWVSAMDAAVASEGSCPSLTFYYSIAYPASRMPSIPLTFFTAYSASSPLDLLCIITDECVDPARRTSPF